MDESVITGIAVGIGLFLFTHLCIAIWFASSMKSKVTEITLAVTEMTADLKEMAKLNTRLTVLEQRMERAEQDTREVLKAAAVVAANKDPA